MVRIHNEILWVGLADRGKEQIWRFITDNTICKPNEGNLFPWAAGEPNNEGGEHCARVQHWKKTSTTGLIDVDCSASIYGLCEIKK